MSGRPGPAAEPLHVGYTRREFLQLGQPDHPATPGRPVLRLSALSGLSDREVGALVPRLVEGCQVGVESDGVRVRLSPHTAPERVCPADPGAAALVAALDQRINLARLAERVAATAGVPYAEAFSLVKAAFLALAAARAVVPA